MCFFLSALVSLPDLFAADVYTTLHVNVAKRASKDAVLLVAATGLYYLAELVEEYTKLAKRIITYVTQAVLVLHVLVLVVDRLPVRCVVAGMAAHSCYLGELQKYPFMQLWSPVTAGSIG